MDCDAAQILIHAHLDRELDPARDLEVEQHLAQCPRCAREFESLRGLRLRLIEEQVCYSAPLELEEKVRHRIRAATLGRKTRPWWPTHLMPRVVQFAVAMAVGAILTLVAAPRLIDRTTDQLIAREVVASHVRALMPGHLMDVASTDQHTVKPWFNGKIDFSPPVKDFAANGFALIGGRIDYVDDRPVAALVYRHRKHLISVFMWPAAGKMSGVSAMSALQGYNVIRLTVAGMDCWVVSDLNREKLNELAGLLKVP